MAIDLSSATVWQLAAGDTNRSYADLCITWDVILNGPGYAGEWPLCEPTLRHDRCSSRKLTDLRRFAEEIQDGDYIVLRTGTSQVAGVGQVVGGYVHADIFGDVDGWDLQHVRRVRWLWTGAEGAKAFDTYAMKLGDTTQRLGPGPVRDWLSSLSVAGEKTNRPIVQLPASSRTHDVSITEISEYLFNQGVASASISSLVAQMGELVHIAKWYGRTTPPSEHETVAYLVIPLLRALGWTPQRVGVEWNRVDVALFDRLPREASSLRVVVEAKRMGRSCLSAMSQAAAYAEGKARCHGLIVTDGIRYGVYHRIATEPFRLYAYMNLARLRSTYPIYNCRGVQDALLAMSPEWRYEHTG
jgi:hypothetical protein